MQTEIPRKTKIFFPSLLMFVPVTLTAIATKLNLTHSTIHLKRIAKLCKYEHCTDDSGGFKGQPMSSGDLGPYPQLLGQEVPPGPHLPKQWILSKHFINIIFICNSLIIQCPRQFATWATFLKSATGDNLILAVQPTRLILHLNLQTNQSCFTIHSLFHGHKGVQNEISSSTDTPI